MSPVTFSSVRFSGTFFNLNTYCLGMNAVEHLGGISCQEIEELRDAVSERFWGVEVDTDPHQDPAMIHTAGDQDMVIEADCFIKNVLDAKQVKYNYSPE